MSSEQAHFSMSHGGRVGLVRQKDQSPDGATRQEKKELVG